MALTAPIRTIHAEPPEDVILREVKEALENISVVGQYVLIGLYERPEGKTAGGVYIPGKALDEDQYQSKVGLVLKMGPQAFMDDGPVQFHGFTVCPGQWVVFRSSDGLAMQIGPRKCRLMADVYIKMVLATPDLIY